MKLPENLNCIVTCENVAEVIEFGKIFNVVYSPNPTTYFFKCYRITNSNHDMGWRAGLSFYEVINKYSNYEFLSFKEFKTKYMQEFVLPEKWCVLRDKENHEIINAWFKANGYGSPIAEKDYIAIKGANYISPYMGAIPDGRTVITFDQFKKYVMKIKENIIGYKAPCDLFEGKVKKGTIYKKSIDGKVYFMNMNSDIYSLPKEIVETWEAVFQQRDYKGIVKGSNKSLDYVIKEQGFVECDGKKVSIESLKSFVNLHSSSLLPWEAMGASWHIGCLEDVTREELNDIVIQHNKLFNL
jgi:hypothetical protein